MCIECFQSRGQHLCKFIGTKEIVCIRKEFISHRIGLGHQHGCRFIVLRHQYGCHDIMWKHSIKSFKLSYSFCKWWHCHSDYSERWWYGNWKNGPFYSYGLKCRVDGDLVLIQTFLFYYVNQVILMLTSIFQGQFSLQRKGGLYQNKVTVSLTFTRRLGY